MGSFYISLFSFSQGCYPAAKAYLKEQANIILGVGFSFLVFLVSADPCALSFLWAYNFMLFFRNIILKRILMCCFQNIYTCTFLGQILFHWWPFFNVRFLTCLCSVCVQLLICFSIFLKVQDMIMKHLFFLFGGGVSCIFTHLHPTKIEIGKSFLSLSRFRLQE